MKIVREYLNTILYHVSCVSSKPQVHEIVYEVQKIASLVESRHALLVCSNEQDIFDMWVYPLDIGIDLIFDENIPVDFDILNKEFC